MQLSPDQEKVVRSWVGDDPTLTDLEDLYDVVGSWDEVIRTTLRRKLALLTEQPASFSVPGLSVSNGQNITSLEGLLKKFDMSGGTGLDGDSSAGVIVGRLTRPNNVR